MSITGRKATLLEEAETKTCAYVSTPADTIQIASVKVLFLVELSNISPPAARQ